MCDSAQSIEKLGAYLANMPPGCIPDTQELEPLLAAAWDHLYADDEAMTGSKLHGRMEDAGWEPPCLTFKIERHGGTVLGSTRAELQRWTFDLDKLVATCQTVGRREVKPREKPLKTRPIAEEVAQLIVSGKNDDRIKWHHDGRVHVRIGKILPDAWAKKETLAGRRKRFRRDLTDLLAEAGWEEVRPNWYRRTPLTQRRA